MINDVSKKLIHNDLLASIELIYDVCKFKYSNPLIEAESSEYGAYEFELNNHFVRFRVAKSNPTKEGQFVTLWTRVENGPIQPYDLADKLDFFVVSTRFQGHFGQFVFPKLALHKWNIISQNGKGGKRAIRVYPPWVVTTNNQARKTQAWQLNYFLEISQNKLIDSARSQILYSCANIPMDKINEALI